MQSFLNILLVRKKKLTREKYCFYYQRTTNSTRRERENETLQKAELDQAKLVCGGINFKKTSSFQKNGKKIFVCPKNHITNYVMNYIFI